MSAYSSDTEIVLPREEELVRTGLNPYWALLKAADFIGLAEVPPVPKS